MEQAAILAEVDVLEEAQQYLQLIRDNFLDVKRRVKASGSDDHVSEGSTSMRKCFALLLINDCPALSGVPVYHPGGAICATLVRHAAGAKQVVVHDCDGRYDT